MSVVQSPPPMSSRIGGISAIVILVSAAHGVTHIYPALMAMIYPVAMVELGFTYSQLGVLLGVSSMAGGFLQLIFGTMGRYVPRKVLLGLGNVVLALCMGAIGLAASFAQLFAFVLTTRVSSAPQHPVGSSIIAEVVPPKERATALAINFSVGNLGTLIVPLAAGFIIANLGWRYALYIFTIPGLVVGVLLFLLLKESRGTPQERSRRTPLAGEMLGLLRNRNIRLLLATAAIASGGGGMGIIMNYVPLYLRNYLGLDPSYVGVLFTVLLIGSVAGPMIAGRLGDLLGLKPIMMANLGVAAVLVYLFTLVGAQSLWLPVILVLIGLAVYPESPLMQTYMDDLAGRTSRDVVFSVYFTLAFGMGSVWATIMGYIVEHLGFVTAFYVMGAAYIGAALCLIPVVRPGKGAAAG